MIQKKDKNKKKEEQEEKEKREEGNMIPLKLLKINISRGKSETS